MLKILKRMRKREWIMAILCIVLILGQIWFDLTLPDYMKQLTTLIQSGQNDTAAIKATGLKMLGCALGSLMLTVICGYVTAQLSAGFSYTLREDIFEKVTRMDKQEMNRLSIPSLIVRTTNDVNQIQMLFSMGLMVIVKAPIMAVWAILKIIGKSLKLSMITGAYVLVILGMMAVMIALIVPRFKKVQRLLDEINDLTRENLTGISVVHAFNAEEFQKSKFQVKSDDLTGTQLFNQRMFAGLMPTLALAMNALTMTIYWVGAGMIQTLPGGDPAARIAMFGDVVVFSTYATYVVTSLLMIVLIFMLLPAAQVSAERINEVLDSKSHILSGAETESDEHGTLEFRNVSFRYPDGGQDVLSDISFTAEKGETVAIIGATGSGKSTLVGLAARFYDAGSGQVLVDGKDIREYDFSALYQRVGLIPQKAILFSGSIRSNIAFGNDHDTLTDQDVNNALNLALASEFVNKMQDGINSGIEQGGRNVSGGQKQRLSIARALARKPEILIFDDSFSALDYRTDAMLRAGLAEKLSGTTLLIVAQRIGTIRHADKIIVLEHGKIVGMGSHDELMQSCSVYREIAMSQLSEEELAGKEVKA